MKAIVFGFLVVLPLVDLLVIPIQETKCTVDAYPPPQKDKVETVVINLDLEPEERWKEIAMKMKPQLVNLLQEIKKFTSFILDGKLFDYIDKYLPYIINTLPEPYWREINGIASASGLSLGEVIFYNVFYELTVSCTSIIAETPEGKLYHARNLDFGLFLGWDVHNNTWALPEVLRPLVFNFNFQRRGKTAYTTTGFAGFVGAFTGVRPGVVTVTMNERFTPTGGKIGLLEWILGERDSHWTTFLVRDVLDGATSMNPSKGAWFVLQTNYDHWKSPLIIDDRRTPATECMKKMTQKNVGVKGIFNVLSTIPVLNKLTSYTAVMQVNSGEVTTYRRFCPDPCFPW